MKAKLIVLIALLSLGACNTIEGFGRDVSAGARTVSNAF
ncbi:MAG: entericidin, EcnA/B family [Pseudomonadota bacterium]